jgi:nitrite reductase/ring-hydroxylating ferredoxin subunit
VTQAPAPTNFPAYPVSWYFFATISELAHGPLSRDLFGERLVAFRTATGRIAVLEARCSHLGTDLGCGRVVGEQIQCPYHNWEYDVDGRCTRIPASSDIPAFARQRRYPIAERHGHLYVFNGRQPLFPLPFYDGVDPDELICSNPHEAVLECPWYMIGGNAFDAQHFSASHDRRMMGQPVVDCPGPFSRRASARFAVTGHSLQDRLTRLLAGDEVALSVTDYCGNMILVTATFRRTRSYGLVVTMPLPEGRVQVRVMVLKHRSRSWVGRGLFDHISLAIRHRFITNFLSSDAMRLVGVRYNPLRMIAADRAMVEYFEWLASVSHGRPLSAGGARPLAEPVL